MRPTFHYLPKGGGHWLTPTTEMGGLLPTEFSTRSFGESPSAVVGSRLSQILEATPHPKYSLSAKACRGILTRSNRRGKQQPPLLELALILQSRSECGPDAPGGKGTLIQIETSGTLGCSNDQTIFCMATVQAKAEVLEDVCPALLAGHEHPIVLTFPDGVANTLLNKANLSHQADKDTLVLQIYENHGQDSRITGPLEIAPTVAQKFGTGGNNTPLVLAVDCRNGTVNDINGTLQTKSSGGQSLNLNNVVLVAVPSEAVSFDLAQVTSPTNQSKGSVGVAYSLAKTGQPAVITTTEDGTVLLDGQPCVLVKLLVRRLTPLECERLQGYPDGWTDIGPWVDSKGKAHKESSDSARYMALGNSIALPPWKWVMKRISAQYERDATMASLFDGIGGFPLLWERINGPGSCLWASEIEEFPIAVTRCRFKEETP